MMAQNNAPILVLNTNTKRKFGHKVQMENIAAGNYYFIINFLPNLYTMCYLNQMFNY